MVPRNSNLVYCENFVTPRTVWFIQTRIKKMSNSKRSVNFNCLLKIKRIERVKTSVTNSSLEVFSLFTFVAAVLVRHVSYDIRRVLLQLRVLFVRPVVRSLFEKYTGAFVSVATFVQVVPQTHHDVESWCIVAVTPRISVLRLLVESAPFRLSSCERKMIIQVLHYKLDVSQIELDISVINIQFDS